MIRIENLSVGYSRHAVLSGLDMEIPSGKLVAMVGRNGCGKSTLMRTMAGLQPALAGDIFYTKEKSVADNSNDAEPCNAAKRLVVCDSDSRQPVTGQSFDAEQDAGRFIAAEQHAWKSLAAMSPDEKSRTIAFVNTEKIRVPGFRCRDLVALGRAPYTDWAGNLSAKDEDIVQSALEQVGLSGLADRTMDRMSDGECQKVMIARAIAQDTSVIMLDEPTAFLDYPNRRMTAVLLKRLTSEHGKTVVYSTHDIDLALEHSDFLLLVGPSGAELLPAGSAELPSRLSSAFGMVSVWGKSM
jgi:hypothetical protein